MEVMRNIPVLSANIYADLEIRILKREDAGYPVEITLDSGQEFPRGFLAHIRKRCTVPPDIETFCQIEAVFEHLVNNWVDWDPERQWEFSLLNDLAWHPGTQQDECRRYRPQELYEITPEKWTRT